MNKTPNNQPTPYADALEAWLRFGDRITREQRAMIHATSDQQNRQQGTTPGSAGGFLTNAEFFAEVTQILDARVGMRRFGRTITTATGSAMAVPRLNDIANDGETVAEQGAISEQALVFEQTLMGADKFTSGEVLLSFELLQDALISIPGLLAEAFAFRIGRAQNAAFTSSLLGSVSSVVGAATPAAADILATYYGLRSDYREHPSAAWMMTDAAAEVVRDVAVSGMGIPWWVPGSDGGPDRLLGKPVYANNDLEAIGTGNVSIVFGAGALGFFNRDVQAFSVERLDELRARDGQVSFVGWLRSDGQQVDPDAIVGLEGGA